MHSLFIDSTSGLTIGLLDSNYTWIEYQNIDDKRPSEIIHFEIFNLLKKNNLKLREMQCFVTSGPGSYTGMRLSEGLAQIFELAQIAVYSFYHFDVPRLSGNKKGFWVTNAFKGQIFIYDWNDNNCEKRLVNKDTFVLENADLGFTIDNSDSVFLNLLATKDLIKNKAPEIFSKISSQKQRVPPYYFRTIDEEFRLPC